MEWKWINVSLLDEAPWNYKNADPETQKKLEASMRASGQVENLIVRPVGDRFEVVNGNHRLRVYRKIKRWKRAYCCDIGPVSTAVAIRVAIETNETRFSVDDRKLAAVVASLAESEVKDLASVTRFNQKAVAAFLAMHQSEGPVRHVVGTPRIGHGGEPSAGEGDVSVSVSLAQYAAIKDGLNAFRLTERNMTASDGAMLHALAVRRRQ